VIIPYGALKVTPAKEHILAPEPAKKTWITESYSGLISGYHKILHVEVRIDQSKSMGKITVDTTSNPDRMVWQHARQRGTLSLILHNC
jgi:hypothetical protein